MSGATAMPKSTRWYSNFPLWQNYCAIADGDTLIYATHGHTYNEQNLPPIASRGHSAARTYPRPGMRPTRHIYLHESRICCYSKAGSWHGYMIMENGRFQWKTMTNEVKIEFVDGKRIL